MDNQDPNLGRQCVIIESMLDLKTRDLNPNGDSSTYLGKYCVFSFIQEYILNSAYFVPGTMLETSNTDINKTQSLPSRNLQ